MKILIIENQISILQQKRLYDEGNIVYVVPYFGFCEDFKVYDKSILITDEQGLNKAVAECSFCVFYGKGNTEFSEHIIRLCNEHNKPVVNNHINNKFELDRLFAREESKDLFNPISVTEVHYYSDVASIKGNKFVIKKLEDTDDILYKTHIVNSKEELEFIIKNDTLGHLKDGGSIVEEFIEGTEVTIGIYFDGKNIVGNKVIVFPESKEFLDDNYSGLTGSGTSVVLGLFELDDFKGNYGNFAKELVNFLRDKFSGYKGYLSCTLIFNDSGFYLIEYTIRTGCPTEYGLSLVIKNYSNFLYCCAFGHNYSEGFSIGNDVVAVINYSFMYDYIFPKERKVSKFYIPGTIDNSIHFLVGYSDRCMESLGFLDCLSIHIGTDVEKLVKDSVSSIKNLGNAFIMCKSNFGITWKTIVNAFIKE